jgi:hypothetical protein
MSALAISRQLSLSTGRRPGQSGDELVAGSFLEDNV